MKTHTVNKSHEKGHLLRLKNFIKIQDGIIEKANKKITANGKKIKTGDNSYNTRAQTLDGIDRELEQANAPVAYKYDENSDEEAEQNKKKEAIAKIQKQHLLKKKKKNSKN